MVHSIKTLLPALLLAGIARADVHFNFQTSEYDLDGIKMHQLVFADGIKQITYTPPRGWQYFGDPDRLRLTPPVGQPGDGQVTRAKLPAPQLFDEATMKRLTDEVVAGLPGSATRATVVSQEKNPLQIERKETFLVIVNFELYGMPQTRSVMFLNRDTEQIRFQFTSPQPSFAKLQKQFLASQFTWQNL